MMDGVYTELLALDYNPAKPVNDRPALSKDGIRVKFSDLVFKISTMCENLQEFDRENESTIVRL
jgi:hypothetical protein